MDEQVKCCEGAFSVLGLVVGVVDGTNSHVALVGAGVDLDERIFPLHHHLLLGVGLGMRGDQHHLNPHLRR